RDRAGRVRRRPRLGARRRSGRRFEGAAEVPVDRRARRREDPAPLPPGEGARARLERPARPAEAGLRPGGAELRRVLSLGPRGDAPRVEAGLRLAHRGRPAPAAPRPGALQALAAAVRPLSADKRVRVLSFSHGRGIIWMMKTRTLVSFAGAASISAALLA